MDTQQTPQSTEINMTTELTAAVNTQAKLFTEDIVEVIQAEITRAATTTFGAMSGKIAEDVRRQVDNWATKQLRGQTLFEDRKHIPKEIDGVELHKDERMAVMWGDDKKYCTNYGRIIERKQVSYPWEQKNAPGAKLTCEVIDYIIATDRPADIIKIYNEKYAHAANTVHSARIEKIREEIKQELTDDFAALAEERKRLEELAASNLLQTGLNETQADLLEADKREFAAEIAREAAHRKTTQELETSKKQVALIKQQLARQAARLQAKEALVLAESKRLAKLDKELADRAVIMNLDLDLVSSGEELSAEY